MKLETKLGFNTGCFKRAEQMAHEIGTSTVLGAIFGGLVSLLITRHIRRGVRLVDRTGAIASGDLTGAAMNMGSTEDAVALTHAMQQMHTGSATDPIHRRIDQQTQPAHTQSPTPALPEHSHKITIGIIGANRC